MPCFVLLQLLALHETRDAEVDLVAFLMSTLDPYAVCDIDMACLSAMLCRQTLELTCVTGILNTRLSSYQSVIYSQV